jgi:hypothetical protein
VAARLSGACPILNEDIAGYRIYKETEKNLYEEIKDRGRRQEYIELSAAAVNPIAITAISRTGNVVTVTANQAYRQGDSVVIASVTGASHSIQWNIYSYIRDIYELYLCPNWRQ